MIVSSDTKCMMSEPGLGNRIVEWVVIGQYIPEVSGDKIAPLAKSQAPLSLLSLTPLTPLTLPIQYIYYPHYSDITHLIGKELIVRLQIITYVYHLLNSHQ